MGGGFYYYYYYVHFSFPAFFISMWGCRWVGTLCWRIVTRGDAVVLMMAVVLGPAVFIGVVCRYDDDQLELVYHSLEEMEHNLTAAVVSNDPAFLNTVLSRTVNGLSALFV